MFRWFRRNQGGNSSEKQRFKEAGQPIIAAAYARAVRASRTEPLYPQEVFDRANAAVRAAIAHLNPSGSNGRVDAAGALIISALQGSGVDPDEYWIDVWIRSGRKDFDDYNGTDKTPKARRDAASSDQLASAISQVAAAVPRPS